MHTRPIALVISIMVAAGSPAPAFAEEISVGKVVGGAVWRARRAVAIGPIVGAAAAYAPDPNEFEFPLSFGLGLRLFKIAVVPDVSTIQNIIKQRVKARVVERVKQIVATGKPEPKGDELEALFREVLEEVKKEVLGEAHHPRKLERPRLAISLEGVYLPRSELWQIRTTVGVGVKRITIGPTFAVHLADQTAVFLGGEVDLHVTPTKGARSPVIDLFLRFDYGVSESTRNIGLFVLGARFLLDII